MKILALEFSSDERSVAVTSDSGATLAFVSERDFRGVTSMALLDRAIASAATSRSEIAVIAVGLGPGSYTGIRSAIAIAKGWQLGREVKIAGISTMLCLAEEARLQGIRGEVSIIVDAQRTELYLARYEITETAANEMEPLRIAPVSYIREGIVVGPEASKLVTGAKDLVPRAETLARMALASGKFVPGEDLEPIYLRQTTFVKAAATRQIG
jgi:tRNA threonylcarbamoyladenosine biosynthesis protein TsaB